MCLRFKLVMINNRLDGNESYLPLEYGRILLGVNTTQDVSPNEIKQARKKGFKVDKDGRHIEGKAQRSHPRFNQVIVTIAKSVKYVDTTEKLADFLETGKLVGKDWKWTRILGLH